MTLKIHTIGLLFFIQLILGSALWAQARVEYVPEMQSLNLARFGEFDPDAARSPVAAELTAWEKFYPFVVSLIDDHKIVELSGWAVEATRRYHYEPNGLPQLGILGVSAKNMVYVVTLAELPSDHPSVHRYLQAFIVGLNYHEEFLPNVVIITIRGTRGE